MILKNYLIASGSQTLLNLRITNKSQNVTLKALILTSS